MQLWNEPFATALEEARDAHHSLPSGVDLDALFAETEVHKAARDFTIRFKKRAPGPWCHLFHAEAQRTIARRKRRDERGRSEE